MSLRTVLAVAAFGLCLVPSAVAEPGWSYDAASDLMSPFCPGRTLADCPSPQAEELRTWITEQELAGRSRVEVEEQLYERFGDEILSRPRVRGFGITAYAVPVLAFLAGGSLLVLFLRRQVRGTPGAVPGPASAPADPELERLVDEELDGGRGPEQASR